MFPRPGKAAAPSFLGRPEFPSHATAPYNVAMTLLDAPRYDARKVRIRRNIIIGVLIAIPFVAFFTWYWWNWPEEHRVNQFFHAIEAKNYSQAFALWNSDPDWQQHSDRYTVYPYKQFVSDWGPSGDYGLIAKAKIVVTKEYGSGVVIGVRVNNSPKTLFLWVERKSKTIGFSPVELRF
ncbi:MAG: hypothetical protein ACLQMO_13195 [Acidobacteriaceae bacterium]